MRLISPNKIFVLYVIQFQLNSNLTANSNPFKFGYEDGKYGYYLPDGEGGADTLHPFSSNPKSASFG